MKIRTALFAASVVAVAIHSSQAKSTRKTNPQDAQNVNIPFDMDGDKKLSISELSKLAKRIDERRQLTEAIDGGATSVGLKPLPTDPEALDAFISSLMEKFDKDGDQLLDAEESYKATRTLLPQGPNDQILTP